jgi:hypothetical protein
MTGFCQNSNPKPKQFSNFPETINCSELELSKVFTASAGQNISLSFSDNFSFSGNVKTTLVKYANLQSAIVESPDYFNTIFSVSKIINGNGSVSYTGRIINKNYFDGFKLVKNTAGNYQLIKIETDRFMKDCSQ